MKALVLEAEWSPRPGYEPTDRERREQRADNAHFLYRNPRLSMAARPTPRPGPGEMLVKVKACGVCGTDLHMIETEPEGYMISADAAWFPVALGHEFAGEVVEVGAGVDAFKLGDAVAVESGQWCGTCPPCRAGIFGQCANLNEHGLSLDGGFAEYVLTRPHNCWSLEALQRAYGDDQAVYELGALVEPYSVVYNGLFVRAGGFLPGGHVAVFGAGPIGLAAIQLTRFAGAGTIVAFDTVAERRALALTLGADAALDPTQLAKDGGDAAVIVSELTGGSGIALAVEAAGVGRHTFPVIERLLAIGGKVVQVGVGAGQTPVTMVTMQVRNGNVYGSMGSSGSGIFPAVIRLFAGRRLPAGDIITARFPLDQALDAIARTGERRDGKVLVVP